MRPLGCWAVYTTVWGPVLHCVTGTEGWSSNSCTGFDWRVPWKWVWWMKCCPQSKSPLRSVQLDPLLPHEQAVQVPTCSLQNISTRITICPINVWKILSIKALALWHGSLQICFKKLFKQMLYFPNQVPQPFISKPTSRSTEQINVSSDVGFSTSTNKMILELF